jgi:hypothetical protein
MSAVASVIFIYSLYCSRLGILFAATPRSDSHLAEPYTASTSGDVEQPAGVLVIDLV